MLLRWSSSESPLPASCMSVSFSGSSQFPRSWMTLYSLSFLAAQPALLWVGPICKLDSSSGSQTSPPIWFYRIVKGACNAIHLIPSHGERRKAWSSCRQVPAGQRGKTESQRSGCCKMVQSTTKMLTSAVPRKKPNSTTTQSWSILGPKWDDWGRSHLSHCFRLFADSGLVSTARQCTLEKCDFYEVHLCAAHLLACNNPAGMH